MRQPQIGSKIGSLYEIHEPIDEAPGSCARVFRATDREGQGIAFKVFRSERFENLPVDKSRQLFFTLANEAELLTAMSGRPDVVRLYDLGFIWPQKEEDLWELQRCGLDVPAFAEGFESAYARRHLPYLALQLMPAHESLFWKLKHHPQAVPLPYDEILAIAMQFTVLLLDIHPQEIAYMDPKTEHIFWDRTRMLVIDWNVSKRLLPQEADLEKRNDIQLFAQRVLYPCITGTSFLEEDLRPMPGASATPDVVETVDYRGQERWLDPEMRTWLDAAMLGRYSSASEFLAAVQACAIHYGWELEGHPAPTGSARRARSNMHQGLDKARQAYGLLAEARDRFVDASVQHRPAQCREPERLTRAVSDLLDKWMLL